jgi:hypothetical protein
MSEITQEFTPPEPVELTGVEIDAVAGGTGSENGCEALARSAARRPLMFKIIGPPHCREDDPPIGTA